MCYTFGNWYWWPIWAIPYWIVFVTAVVLLVGSLLSTPSNKREHVARRPAEDILDMRYAQGEIDTEEYKQRVSELQR